MTSASADTGGNYAKSVLRLACVLINTKTGAIISLSIHKNIIII